MFFNWISQCSSIISTIDFVHSILHSICVYIICCAIAQKGTNVNQSISVATNIL